MPVTMYGIKNCDTIKKARGWLEGQGIAYSFHDYKSAGIEPALLRAWVAELGWEVLLNRAGTTFRALPDSEKQGIDAEKAIALMMANPSMIKRPMLDLGSHKLVGFKPEQYTATFANRNT